MNSLYHSNGAIAWNGSYAYHSNGAIAWNDAFAYHSNGEKAWNGSYAYHSNGAIAWNDYYAYLANGQNVGREGIEFEIGNGIRMRCGKSGFRLYVFGNCVVSL